MAFESSGAKPLDARERALWDGKLTALCSLGRPYLFLPFAALCMATATMRRDMAIVWLAAPFLLQIAAMVAAYRLKERFEKRNPLDDPRNWARRFTILSGISGAIWGLGAVIWFDFSSFTEEAYLVLAFLGLSATELVARIPYRPAYLAHAAASLGPLCLLLAIHGGVYQALTALLVIFFGGILYAYGGAAGALLGEGILLRYDHGQSIKQLSSEKWAAESTRDAAQENERAKSIFIANISHELRTPMTAILGMAQLLERSDLPKAQHDHVKVLLEAGSGLKTLLDDIIALASPGDNPLSAPAEGCDAAQATRTVTRLLQPNVWEKRLRLSVNVAPNVPRIAADPRLIRRVLLKLLGNAIKFTDRGSVEIALALVEDDAGRRYVRFAVTDSGSGIPAHMLTAIFEPFAKDGAQSNQTAGAGVGLAVAKRLIESMGGAVGVESELGMGASFWFTVPVLETPVLEESNSAEPVTPPSGLSLLAYLPDDAMHKAIAQMLSRFGNQITTAQTLAQAVTISARGSFAAVLTDASHASALAGAPGQRTPILALVPSGERTPEGADGVVRWPASEDALFTALHGITGAPEAPIVSPSGEASVESLIDVKAVSALETSLGFKTLIDILQSYLATSENLATALTEASAREDWAQAGRIAQDFASAAGGLGLIAVTAAARALAQDLREDIDRESLNANTNAVLSEHRRVRDALYRLYPDLSA